MSAKLRGEAARRTYGPCGRSKGLGLEFVGALAKDIGGELHISTGDDDRAARFTVAFRYPALSLPGAAR